MTRRLKSWIFAVAIIALAFSSNAGCLSQYNSALYRCDYAFCPNGALTCAGCYADALGGYYHCVLNLTMD